MQKQLSLLKKYWCIRWATKFTNSYSYVAIETNWDNPVVQAELAAKDLLLGLNVKS